MKHSAPRMPDPDALFAFVEGVHRLDEYLRENNGRKLSEADELLTKAYSTDPSFNLAAYYRGIALTHLRKTDAAIEVFEELKNSSVPFKTEVLYNLGFAYAKKYRYDL